MDTGRGKWAAPVPNRVWNKGWRSVSGSEVAGWSTLGVDLRQAQEAAQSGRSICISGGMVADGSGDPLCAADVLVTDGVVAEIASSGRLLPHSALVLDARGQVVCPGFIDVHSHADNAPLLAVDDLSKIQQGVTTEVVGNCGFSLAPVGAGRGEQLAGLLGRIFPAVDLAWSSFSELFVLTDARGYVTNYAPMVGHNTLRIAAMGMVSRAPDAGELRQMTADLETALAEGLFGLSTGLGYPPGMFSPREELIALARALPTGRVYATHMRDEGSQLLNSIAETVAVAEEAHCQVQVSHLKSGGRANWGRVGEALKALDDARSRGLAVGQDVYPYEAVSTMLTACLPSWFEEGDNETVLSRLRNPGALARARAEVRDGAVYRAGRDGVLIASTGSHRYEGSTLVEIADQLGLDPFDALVRVLQEERLRATMVVVSMDKADVDSVIRHPATVVGSDGLPPGLGGRPHPRQYGTFPRVLQRYVRERKILGLAEAVAKMTALPADTFGLKGRGRVIKGAIADLVVFSPPHVNEVGTYSDPARAPEGISAVLMAGRPVVYSGQWLGTRRGRRLTA